MQHVASLPYITFSSNDIEKPCKIDQPVTINEILGLLIFVFLVFIGSFLVRFMLPQQIHVFCFCIYCVWWADSCLLRWWADSCLLRLYLLCWWDYAFGFFLVFRLLILWGLPHLYILVRFCYY